MLLVLWICVPSQVFAERLNSPDVNGDGVVNIIDLAIVARCVGVNLATNLQCRTADMNGDGIVDSTDVNYVRSAFGKKEVPTAPTLTLDRTSPGSRGSGLVKGAGATATISIQSSPLLASPSQPITLNVTVSGIADLYAFQFDIVVDPGVLSASSVTEGPFLAGAGTTLFIPGTIDNIAGTITSTADTLIGAVAGASGSGTLATTFFTVLDTAPSGASPVTLSNVILLDSNLNDIAATSEQGTVNVETNLLFLWFFFS